MKISLLIHFFIKLKKFRKKYKYFKDYYKFYFLSLL